MAVMSCEPQVADPRIPVLVGKAWESLRSLQYHQALTLADSAVALGPHLADAQFVRGRVLFELNQFAASETAYLQVLKLDPSYPGAHHNLGNALFGQQRYQDAIIHFRAEAAANSWHAAGAAYMELGQPENALSAMRQAIALDSAYLPVHKSLAELHEQLGQYDQALVHARTSGDHYLTGLMLFHLNRYDQAASLLEHVLTDDPSHHSALYTLGQVQLRRGATDEAQSMLSRANQLRQQHRKIAALGTAARENPTSFAHQIAHANALRDAGHLRKAVQAWLIALVLRPANLELQSNIATAFQQLGDTTEAVARHHQVLQNDSTHVSTLVNLGWHFFQTDRRREAVNLWARAARHHPDHPAISALRETLAQQQPGNAQSSPAQ